MGGNNSKNQTVRNIPTTSTIKSHGGNDDELTILTSEDPNISNKLRCPSDEDDIITGDPFEYSQHSKIVSIKAGNKINCYYIKGLARYISQNKKDMISQRDFTHEQRKYIINLLPDNDPDKSTFLLDVEKPIEVFNRERINEWHNDMIQLMIQGESAPLLPTPEEQISAPEEPIPYSIRRVYEIMPNEWKSLLDNHQLVVYNPRYGKYYLADIAGLYHLYDINEPKNEFTDRLIAIERIRYRDHPERLSEFENNKDQIINDAYTSLRSFSTNFPDEYMLNTGRVLLGYYYSDLRRQQIRSNSNQNMESILNSKFNTLFNEVKRRIKERIRQGNLLTKEDIKYIELSYFTRMIREIDNEFDNLSEKPENYNTNMEIFIRYRRSMFDDYSNN